MRTVAESQPRTGVLVIRAWIEREGPDGLRVRITSTLDVTQAAEQATAAADVRDVLAIVERWFAELLAGP